MKKFFLSNCFFLLSLFVSGCQGGKKEEISKTQLRIGIGADPLTLDPRKAHDLTAVTLMHMFFEGLTRNSKEGPVELALAESVEVSEDGREYTFRLHPSFWSNGAPLSSFDFVQSYKTLLEPNFPSGLSYLLFCLKNGKKIKMGEVSSENLGVSALDALTLRIELEDPVPYFLQLLTMPPFFPVCSKVDQENPNWAQDPTVFVCNGPFLPTFWQHSDCLLAEKNMHYWQKAQVQLEKIELCMLHNQSEIALFEEGKLDWAGSPLSTLPIDAIGSLREKKEFSSQPFFATYFFRVNTKEKIEGKKTLLQSAAFRKALCCALNRKEITQYLLQGGQIPAKSLVPPDMGLTESGYFLDDHPEKAQALFTDALLELDLSLEQVEPITLSFCSNERNLLIAQAVQKHWEKALSIQIELEPLEPKLFYQKMADRTYQLAAGSWTADFDDPINFLEVFKWKEGGTNNTGWESAKYIDLLNQSAVCKEKEERKNLLRQAEQILMEQMPVIPLFHFALNFLQSPSLEDVALSPLGKIDFRWAHR